jgi:hypothetical protein
VGVPVAFAATSVSLKTDGWCCAGVLGCMGMWPMGPAGA